METELINNHKNKWKLVGIILIVLFVATVAAGVLLFLDLKETEDKLKEAEDKLSTNVLGTGDESNDEGQSSNKNPDVVTVEELQAAYANAGFNLKVSLHDNSNIIDGGVSPYQIVQAGTEDGYLYFYRIGVDGEWIFGYGGNGIPECAIFESSRHAIRAFADHGCLTRYMSEDVKVRDYYEYFFEEN